jgi:hypothetical protein
MNAFRWRDMVRVPQAKFRCQVCVDCRACDASSPNVVCAALLLPSLLARAAPSSYQWCCTCQRSCCKLPSTRCTGRSGRSSTASPPARNCRRSAAAPCLRGADSFIQKLLGMQSQPSSSGTIPAATAAVMKSRRPPDEEAPYARERVQGPTSFTSAPSTSPWATAALPQPQHSQCVDAAGRTAAQWSFLQFLADTSIVTALGVSLLLYTQIAKVACGLLMCVNVGQTPRWVLDVRLQCPSLPPYPACGAGVVVFGVFLVLGCLAWPVTLAGVLICHAHQGRLLLLGSSQPAASTTVAQHAHTKDASHAAGGVGRTSGAGTALLACTAQYADTNSRSAVRATARLSGEQQQQGELPGFLEVT